MFLCAWWRSAGPWRARFTTCRCRELTEHSGNTCRYMPACRVLHELTLQLNVSNASPTVKECRIAYHLLGCYAMEDEEGPAGVVEVPAARLGICPTGRLQPLQKPNSQGRDLSFLFSLS